MQINDLNQRIDTEKARGAKLKQKVQLHVSLNTQDQVRKQNVSDYILIQDLSGSNTQKSCLMMLSFKQ